MWVLLWRRPDAPKTATTQDDVTKADSKPNCRKNPTSLSVPNENLVESKVRSLKCLTPIASGSD